ncbi:glycosyltransferase family 2 protein [Heyndrickxia oleronia]|uniref:glycosyltransferase family 2 protein n=1 Tax=Heyndrickxia oleronia TaxID=38875 RepID=UPI00203B076E|nr:glycosyltransferase family 2 protein [Heyndrickxia oleronia]MCM3238363.1 glycosyltransferase family 2 protein [Heyndrickxia oleronia]
MESSDSLIISLAMIVKNEENSIKRCIDSVKSLVDEIVIVDTGSTDKTMNILSEYSNIKVFNFEWCDDFSLARNYSIENTTGDYVLVLDADEYLIDGSRDELKKVMVQKKIGRIQINSHFIKDAEEYHSKSYVSRFFPRKVRYTGVIHEQLETQLPRMKMNFKVEHSGYYKTNKSERNIPLLLKEIKNNPTDSYYLFQLGKELRINKRYEESFYFLSNAYHLTPKNISFYKELIVELINSGKECKKEEVLQIIKQNEEILKNVSDFHFAKGLFYLDYSLKNPSIAGKYLSKIESSFLKCLQLKEKIHTEYILGTSSYLASYNLGVFYEVTGNLTKAVEYYFSSHAEGYQKASKRLEMLNRM